MKKLALFLFLLTIVFDVFCQDVVNKNLFYVKLGANCSYVKGGPQYAKDHPARFGLVTGLEYERLIGDWGISLGALFSMQGGKEGFWSYNNNMFVFPVSLNYHFSSIPLTLRVGMQYGVRGDVYDWSMPISAYWSWKKIYLEAAYKHGVKTWNPNVWDAANSSFGQRSSSPMKAGQSRTISLSVGYNFFSW
ncbi:MAG: hypothetical protein J5980_00930 [Muribaculaceae bacterium]|nr:hypothetical protein [Muribaculaceae bacterium]